MKSKLILCLRLVLSAALFGGCASRQPVALPDYQIDDIHMFNGDDGWAEARGPGGSLILKTTDGALRWKNVTPRPFPYDTWGSVFASMKTAWVTVHTNTWDGLLMTTNGGSSWAQVTTSFDYFTEGSEVRFVTDDFGVAQLGDFGAGSVYYSFYQTLDGGLTWTPIAVTWPDSNPNETSEVHLSSAGGDKMAYCPPKTFIVAYGDLAGSDDFPSVGYVALSISTNFGKSWRDARLPLPDEERKEFAAPCVPVFFSERDGVLPVEIFSRSFNSMTFHELLFYRTTDGGETWSVSGAIATSQNWMETDCDVISPKDIVVRKGGVLNVTHDGGKTWRVIRPDIDLGVEDANRDVSRMNFADLDHGWMIISDLTTPHFYGNYLFYRTTDGGKKWAEVPLKILE